MEAQSDEIYVAWDDESETVIRALCCYFNNYNHSVEVHLFTHRQKLHESEIRQWPSNFTFHFSATNSTNALATSLIAYVLEKFEKISDEILSYKSSGRKTKIFFIQKTVTEFEELKTMASRLPFISDYFSFKLLGVTSDVGGSEFLFEAFKGQTKTNSSRVQTRDASFMRSISENDTLNDQNRIIQHGRRASDILKLNSSPRSLHSSLSIPRNSAAGHECGHCDRRRGSKPNFMADQKKLFCLACYLNADINEDDQSLCKKCLRTKHIETTDKSTSFNHAYFSDNKSVQCNLGKVSKQSASTTTKSAMGNLDASTQTESCGYTDEELQNMFYELMGKIDANQDDLIKQVQNRNNVVEPLESFRISDIPKNPTTNKYHCPYCPTKSYARLEIFEVHLKNVHKKCNCSCDQYFESREDYLDHFYEVFPLPCFQSRKCPERFRTIHYQASHHETIHNSMKPYYCVACYNAASGEKSLAFPDVRSLQLHGLNMNHTSDEMFLSVSIDGDNDMIPMTARSTAINYSG